MTCTATLFWICSVTGEKATTTETGSKTYKVIKAEFDEIPDPVQDGYEATITLILEGADPSEFEIEITASVPEGIQPQNEIGHTNHTISQDGDNTSWKIEKGIWYGSDGRLCVTDENATYDLKLTATYQGKKIVKESSMKVRLDDDATNEAYYTTNPPTGVWGHDSNSQNNGVYYERYKITGYMKWAYATADSQNQYKAKLSAEEEYHKQQLEGDLSFEEGGTTDTYTVKGFDYFMDQLIQDEPLVTRVQISEGLWEFSGDDFDWVWSTAEHRFAQAESEEMLKSIEIHNSNIRKCYRELKAKEHADYKEAYTYRSCTYKWCMENPNPNAKKHPAW